MTDNATITRAALARMIDHTLLAPEATDDDVARLAADAARLGAGAWLLPSADRLILPASRCVAPVREGST